ncbi:hypothetical protein [Novosphingobium album (ex Hu et al. 2023)]|uniref:Uncharacterized protein n=1 Tax=Novosphingobium album (ex Hu et al. 2023) TaxID=2930093 RepID=A0ABT0B4Q7_9SPHN|nr:hypothetical protein [Novosphingobium album (ex Hu et al. 2023)]MCJ2179874.1 hypothetical protein [Novosphingobium album (ex Hu et al. 2023)]
MLKAYNCRADGPAQELGQMDLKGALALVDAHWAFADDVCETDDEAVEKSMFGFYRDDEDFIEIEIVSSSLITVRHEPERDGFIGKIFGRREWLIHLHEREELDAIVKAYFTSTQAGLEAMQSYPNEALE